MDVLVVLLLWPVCERACFSLLHEYKESIALLEYVIMTSMFLYGVVQPAASVLILTGVSALMRVVVCFSEPLQ